MRTHLTCSCCGNASWKGQQDPSHDKGFGTCRDCSVWIEKRDASRVHFMIAKLAEALNPENRARFKAMDPDLQRAMLARCIEDGVMKFEIKPGKMVNIHDL